MTARPIIKIINGPNLNLLGLREPHLYGSTTLAQVEELCKATAEDLGIDIEFHQSNHEGVIIDLIHEARERCQGILINPAGFTSTSIAILDGLLASELPIVEVHVTNIHKREELEFQPSSQHSDRGVSVMAIRARGRENAQYKAKERDEFFRRLDRGGTIRAVAAELGLSVESCYRWRNEAGVSTPRVKSRVYTTEDKAEFFRLLALTGNVSKVAKELGFVRVTCYKWAHQAGIFTGKDTRAQRAQFERLRADGVSRADAARQVGVDKRSAQDWDKGIKQIPGGRVYPDGRVVRYRQAAILANVKNPREAYTRGAPVDLARLETVVDSRYLSLIERERIHDLRSRGDSMRAIGRALGRSASTISREIARNTATTVGYLPYAAHRIAASRRPRCHARKLEPVSNLRAYVEGKLRKRWSPEQISHRLVKDFPNDQGMRVSTETIYQAIYVQGRGALKREIATAMRRGRTTRKPRRDPAKRTSRFVDPMVSITERPADAADRAVPGHWESQ